MVAILSPNTSIRESLYYNENKVKVKAAVCLMAANYPKKHEELSVETKLNMLQKMASLNTKTTVNCLHISLNFDPSEQIETEKLKEIVRLYMDQLGFGNQPYLVYQHFDAGHPHLHVVTTNIESDGKRIDLHHLGIRKSEPARKALEVQFGLVKAEDQKEKQARELRPVGLQKVTYGRSDSRRAVANVLAGILKTYRYTSLPELNAVLKQYNVMADRGSEKSKVFEHRGLIYHILDEAGKPIGVPIKASLLPGKPTLKYLDGRFIIGKTEREKHKIRVKNAIDMAFHSGTKPSLEVLIQALEKQGIHTVLRKNETGLIYGITFIDHQTKCVFNGRALDKAYSAAAIQERCGQPPVYKKQAQQQQHESNQKENERAGFSPESATKKDAVKPVTTGEEKGVPGGGQSFIDALLQQESINEQTPFDLKSRRKKKKRRQINNN